MKTLYSGEAIQKRVEELGAQITADYQGTGKIPLLIGILKGSVIFCADLMRAIQRGAKLVALDPRRTKTAELASEWHAIRPGTDYYYLEATIKFADGKYSISPNTK